MDTPFLGMIQYYAFNFAPRGWTNCAGQLLPINGNTALFSLLGTTYGGNGINNFALPDLRGRSMVGMGNGFTEGQIFGTENVSLTTSNMPVHTHTVPAMPVPANVNLRSGGDTNDPTGAYPSSPASGNMYTATPGRSEYLGTPAVTVGVAGSGTPFSILNPYLALTCCISLVGIFPSRN